MSEAFGGASPGEGEIVSTADALAAAAQAFKAEIGEGPPPTPAQGAPGRSAGQGGGDEEDEIDAADEAGADAPAEAGAEMPGPGESDDAAAGEAGEDPASPTQPDAAGLPESWPADKAELWNALSPDAQAYLRQRDGEQRAAINARFMEAAALKKAHEAEIEAANLDRRRYQEAVDQVMSLVVPQPPPRSMLDRASSDYDPDAYHYRKALHEETVAFLDGHARQRQELAAQEEARTFGAIDGATREAFIAAVPEAADRAKAPALFQELIDYAVSIGTPETVFATPTTALEWHLLWKAKEYDRLQAARARVRETPPPEPRKPAPAVRPGVTSPRSAIDQARRHQALERLRKEGSVEAGAAAIRHLMKGRQG